MLLVRTLLLSSSFLVPLPSCHALSLSFKSTFLWFDLRLILPFPSLLFSHTFCFAHSCVLPSSPVSQPMSFLVYRRRTLRELVLQWYPSRGQSSHACIYARCTFPRVGARSNVHADADANAYTRGGDGNHVNFDKDGIYW